MNVNDQIKMKVLADLKKHMDGKMGEKLRPKKAVEVSTLKVEPADITEGSGDHAREGLPELAPGVHSLNASGPKDLTDDDTHRLMQLYGSLK